MHLARLLVAAALFIVSTPVHAAEVIVFGDSWAEGAADELQAALRAAGHDYDVAGYGVGGTTAELWAATPAALPDAVALNPDARWLWLSIGGNDVFAQHLRGTTATESNDRNMRVMLDALHARHPDLRVVLMAYDYPNYEQSEDCIANALAVFGPVATPVLNQFFHDEIEVVHSGIAADDPRISFVPMWGTLQLAGGVPGAPTVLRPSPARFMADCIHPTSQGYRLLHDRLVAEYWGAEPPVAVCDVCPDAVCLGDSATLRSGSTPDADVVWVIDGVPVSDDAEYAWTPAALGPVTVDLVAHRMAWTDTATHTVTVRDCGAPDVEPDAGPGGDADVGIDATTDADGDPPDGGVSDDAIDDTGTDPPDAMPADAAGDAAVPEGDVAASGDGAPADGSAADEGAPSDASRGSGSGGCAVAGSRAPGALSLLLLVALVGGRRPHRRTRRRVATLGPALLGAALLLVAGCGGDDAGSSTVPGDASDVDTGAADADAGLADTGSADADADADAGSTDAGDASDASDALDADAAAPGDAATDASIDVTADADAATDTVDDAATDVGDDAAADVSPDADPDVIEPPRTPQDIFGSLYWDVYRPRFLAEYFDDGRVTDRRDFGTPMFGDNTMFMGKALSTFLFEYQAAGLEESLGYMHTILDAYLVLDAMPANPTFGYLIPDPLDGYMYRSDRGPDYETNYCQRVGEFCIPDLATRNNEPSGDQYMHTLAALRDVVDYEGELIHDGVDLKDLARGIAGRLGDYLRDDRYVMKNLFGNEVRRGPDQRPASWAFAQGAANVSGRPASDFETTWNVLGIPIPIASQRGISHEFIRGTYVFTDSCVGGEAIDVGFGLEIPVSCNEFNIGLGWASAVMSLSRDPDSPDWFSAVVPMDLAIAEGSAMTAMYARYRFNDPNPALIPTIELFLTAPNPPPTSDNRDPNGWCESWRWAHDFDDPDRCADRFPGSEYSGLDYMWPRAMASAYGEFPPDR